MTSSLFLKLAIFLFAIYDLTFAIPISQQSFNNYTASLRIVSREEWGAREPKDKEPMESSPTPYVVVHHGGIKQYCSTFETCTEIARSYQDLHMDDRGWFDIGYSFVIGEDGNAYEGRGWDSRGAHAPGYNSQSIGICVMGDFSDFLPSDEALKTLNALIAYGVEIGKISRNYKVIGHRQARDTLCPGETFYKYVQALPRWTPCPVPTYSADVTTQASISFNENTVETGATT